MVHYKANAEARIRNYYNGQDEATRNGPEVLVLFLDCMVELISYQGRDPGSLLQQPQRRPYRDSSTWIRRPKIMMLSVGSHPGTQSDLLTSVTAIHHEMSYRWRAQSIFILPVHSRVESAATGGGRLRFVVVITISIFRVLVTGTIIQLLLIFSLLTVPISIIRSRRMRDLQ